MSNTRFAPSFATDYFHIESVRTAIFNWLLAQRTGGRFLLRIDDIDNPCSKPSLDNVVNGLRWLGLNWDDYRHQSASIPRYESICERLLSAGIAYRCYCTKTELEIERSRAISQCRPVLYSGRCRYIPFDCFSPHSVRLDVNLVYNRKREVGFKDAVLGEITCRLNMIEDFIIRRRDGTFTPDFVNAVDDFDSKIDYVLREQSQLWDTIKQIAVLKAIAYIQNEETALPVYGHLPYLCLPGTKKKLTKRHADSLGICVTLEQYRSLGYLPEAVLSGLGFMNWQQHKRSVSELLDDFDLKMVPRHPIDFNPDVMYWLQERWTKTYDHDQLVEKIHRLYNADRKFISQVLDAFGGITLLTDFKKYLRLFGEHDPVELDPVVSELVGKMLALLEKHHKWSAESLKAIAGAFSDEERSKLNEALQLAIAGQKVTIDIYKMMSILGKKKTCRRLRATSIVAV